MRKLLSSGYLHTFAIKFNAFNWMHCYALNETNTLHTSKTKPIKTLSPLNPKSLRILCTCPEGLFKFHFVLLAQVDWEAVSYNHCIGYLISVLGSRSMMSGPPPPPPSSSCSPPSSPSSSTAAFLWHLIGAGGDWPCICEGDTQKGKWDIHLRQIVVMMAKWREALKFILSLFS